MGTVSPYYFFFYIEIIYSAEYREKPVLVTRLRPDLLPDLVTRLETPSSDPVETRFFPRFLPLSGEIKLPTTFIVRIFR